MNQFMKETRTMVFDTKEFKIGDCWEIKTKQETINGIVIRISDYEIEFLFFDKKHDRAMTRRINANQISTGEIIEIKLTKLINPDAEEEKEEMSPGGWGDLFDAMQVGYLSSEAQKDGFDVINDIKTFAYGEGRY